MAEQITPSKVPSDKEKQHQWFSSLLQADMLRDFWGTVTVKLEKGNIIFVKREQTHLPPKNL